MEAYHIRQFYKVEELDDKILDFDQNGRSRPKVVRLELLLHGLTTAAQRDLKNMERQSKHGHGMFLPDLSSHSLGVKLRELSGLKDFLKPGVEFTNEDLESFAQFCRNNSKAIKLAIGLAIPDNVSNIWIYQKVCEQLGVKTKSTRHGRAQIRTVCIDPENFEVLSDIVARRQIDQPDHVVWSPENVCTQETIQHNYPVIYDEPPKQIQEEDSGQEIAETLWLMETAAQYQDTETLEQMRGVYSRKTLQETAKILKQKSMEAWLWVKGVVVSQNQLGFGSITG